MADLAACRAARRGPAQFWLAGTVALTLGAFAAAIALAPPASAPPARGLAHGLQYLLLLGLVAAGNPRSPGRALRLAALGNVALAGGLALSAASHRHGAGPAGRLLFGAYLGAVMARFVVDAGLWRLRDPFPRAFLPARAPALLPPRRGPDDRISAADRSAAELLT